MDAGTWSDASQLVTETAISAIDADFELVTLTLTLPSTSVFFRLDVSLSE